MYAQPLAFIHSNYVYLYGIQWYNVVWGMSTEEDTYSQIEQRFESLQQQIDHMNKVLRGLANWPDPWITLKRACAMKGVSWETVRRTPWRQPNGGEPDEIINNRVYWRPETIQEWILLGDRELARRYKTQ